MFFHTQTPHPPPHTYTRKKKKREKKVSLEKTANCGRDIELSGDTFLSS